MTEYELIRSNRKTAAIFIIDTRVVVKAPVRLGREKIDAFVRKNQAWIDRKRSQASARTSALNDFLTYEKFLLHGQSFGSVFAEVKDFSFDNGALLIPNRYKSPLPNARNLPLLKKLEAYYKKTAFRILGDRLAALSATAHLPYASFRLTNAVTKWGTCDTLNRIRLNWRLLLIDDFLCDYVIIHELCHTYYHNHSKDFRTFLSKFDPDYKKHTRILKDYGPVVRYMFRYTGI